MSFDEAAIVIALRIRWNWRSQILGPHYAAIASQRTHRSRSSPIGPTEGFRLHMKAAFFSGLFHAAPLVLYHISAYHFARSDYARERRKVIPYRGKPWQGVFLVAAERASSACICSPSTFRFLGQHTTGEFLRRTSEGQDFAFYFWFIAGLLRLSSQAPRSVIFVLYAYRLVTASVLLRNREFASWLPSSFLRSSRPSADVVEARRCLRAYRTLAALTPCWVDNRSALRCFGSLGRKLLLTKPRATLRLCEGLTWTPCGGRAADEMQLTEPEQATGFAADPPCWADAGWCSCMKRRSCVRPDTQARTLALRFSYRAS